MQHDTKLFLTEAFRSLRRTGSVVPSTTHLARRMAMVIPRGFEGTVVELGVGTGVITKAILERAGAGCRVAAFEANDSMLDFARSAISDERVNFIHDIAQSTEKHVGKGGADYIISGLPLGSMKRADREAVLAAISRSLKPGGAYVQFQYFLSSLPHIKKHFKNVRVAFYETRNFPPAFVLESRKA